MRLRSARGWSAAGLATVALLARAAAAQAADAAPQVVKPGWAVWLVYLAIVAVAAMPAAYVAISLALTRRLPPREASRARGTRRAGYAMLAPSLALAGLVAGYAFEAVHTEVKLAPEALEYAGAGERVRMPWSEIRSIELTSGKGGQELQVCDARRVLHIRLLTFAVAERRLLVNELPQRAQMPPPMRRGADEWLWRRRLVAPE